jgi:PAS domain-containing protein
VDDLRHELSELRAQVGSWEKKVALNPDAGNNLLPEVIEEIRTGVEDLHIAEEELREESDALIVANETAEADHERYRRVFENAPAAYLLTDARGVIFDGNRAAAALLGEPPGRGVTRLLATVIQWADRGRYRRALSAIGREQGPLRIEVTLAPKGMPSVRALLLADASHGDSAAIHELRWLIVPLGPPAG